LPEESIVAAILAGGRSSRFGAPKALADLAGRPLIAHVAAALAEAADIAVVGHRDAADAISATRLSDPPGAAVGPLGGLLAGLAWADQRGASWLCVAPCDTPLLPLNLVSRLRAAADHAPMACVATEAGVEPLISIWRTSLLAPLRDALREGAHPAARDIAVQFDAAHLQLTQTEIMNVNTREDFARAEAAYRAKF
jgi:molybdopterin-guanine dinucleotide biosynthesis protein A